jgi:excisionase family DNA binding protein
VTDRGADVDKQRFTIQEVAHKLGVSESAIRKRIKRGTLEHEKTEGGRVLVYLDTGSAPVTDTVPDPTSEPLMSEMKARISLLESELEAWREESRRKDTIIMNMTEAMKAISPPAPEEPPQEPSEASETAREGSGRVGHQPSLTGAQEPDTRERQVPWWRRVFRG